MLEGENLEHWIKKPTTTLAASTPIILFSEMLRFSDSFSNNKKL